MSGALQQEPSGSEEDNVALDSGHAFRLWRQRVGVSRVEWRTLGRVLRVVLKQRVKVGATSVGQKPCREVIAHFLVGSR